MTVLGAEQLAEAVVRHSAAPLGPPEVVALLTAAHAGTLARHWDAAERRVQAVALVAAALWKSANDPDEIEFSAGALDVGDIWRETKASLGEPLGKKGDRGGAGAPRQSGHRGRDTARHRPRDRGTAPHDRRTAAVAGGRARRADHRYGSAPRGPRSPCRRRPPAARSAPSRRRTRPRPASTRHTYAPGRRPKGDGSATAGGSPGP
ncbi:hypothetical protein LT493_42350 [Streptomyces tricolor]|nr:hypothetical protein [Streptomyces tricolor]